MRIKASASWEDGKSSLAASRKAMATNGQICRNVEGIIKNHQRYPEDFATNGQTCREGIIKSYQQYPEDFGSSASGTRQSKLDSSMLSNNAILQNYYTKKINNNNPVRSHVDNHQHPSSSRTFQPSFSFETDEYLIIQQHHTEVSHNMEEETSDKYMFIDSRFTHKSSSNNNRPSNFKEPSIKSTIKNITSSRSSHVDVTDNNHFDSRLSNGRSSSNRVRDSYNNYYRCQPSTIDEYKTKTEYLLSKNKQRVDQKIKDKLMAGTGSWTRDKSSKMEYNAVSRYSSSNVDGRAISENGNNYQRYSLSNMDSRTASDSVSRYPSSSSDGRRLSENDSNYHRYGLDNINQNIDNSLDSLDDNSSVFSNTTNNNIESYKSAPSKSSTGYSSYSAGYSHQKKRSLDLESTYSDSSTHSNNSSHLNSDTNSCRSRYQLLSMTSSLDDRCYQNGGVDYRVGNGFDSNNNSDKNRDVDSLKLSDDDDDDDFRDARDTERQNGGATSVVPVPSSTRPLGLAQQIPRARTYYETILSAQYSSSVVPSRTGRQRYRSIKNFTSLSRPLLIG
ncbi:uncharacterized protein DDB_G0283357 [Nilaparvata lugens]|uniref:uncharacterized protein DDB_G0283357 n=1 Tax=Nilaparvata lugens TaxID=108931 RepID=UPI00193D72D1|nr:uncharacterized protein DDB_G0283357 [Nilaparvata lugens]